jgi:ribosomal protein S12 methylthiotransferase accessory factor
MAADWQRRIERDILVSTPVLTPFGHTRSLEDTYRWIQPRLRHVPISRVYDATPLDRLGLPVWAAVTPLAADLTVHAGKGTTSEASRLSAIMEAVERSCAEALPPERMIRSSYEDLCRSDNAPDALDPAIFDLPFETIYEPSLSVSWTAGYDLARQRPVLVPADLVVSPAREGVCRGVETNGLASGNTYIEAIVHALCELIERDASSREEFRDLYCDAGDSTGHHVSAIDPQTLPAHAQSLLHTVLEQPVEIRLLKLHSAVGVPVYGAVLTDELFPGHEGYPLTFGGYGCDLDPERAVLRAITEAAQSHTVVTVAARDVFEGTRPAPDRAFRLQRNLDARHPQSFSAFEKPTVSPSDDLLTDLNRLLGKFSAAGFRHCIVADLARDDLGVPVVRALVPGLSSPYGYSTRRPTHRLLLDLA